MRFQVLEGDCRTVMATLPTGSVDAIVSDPPYHLTVGKKGGTGVASANPDSPAGRARISTGFMGKGWDGGDVAFRPETWAAALRVAKPGAHLVAFGGTRTFHRLTCAIEDAGWEIRDCLSWLYGSGFPKSLDVSRAIDDAWHAKRKRVVENAGTSGSLSGPRINVIDAGQPVTDAAKQWQGWGTALKPGWEPIILARKPLNGTVAANVQENGTGALNIDGCRMAGGEKRFLTPAGNTGQSPASVAPVNVTEYLGKETTLGRWPANVVLDEQAAAALDRQSGEIVSRIGKPRGAANGEGWGMTATGAEYSDSGGASRFFYTAKASRSEREAGLEHRPRKAGGSNAKGYTEDVAKGQDRNRPVGNHHPTVKPLDLMQWLCRLITPRAGLILDPFCGSGSTGRAAVAEGFSFVGIELDPEYAAIARARIADYAPLFHDPEAA